MQGSTVKNVFLALILASALPLAACSDDNDTPTAPTQPGPPVGDTPPPAPDPDPPPPPPPPPPDDDDDDPVPVTVSGGVFNLSRSGEGDLDIMFRIDDFNIVKGDANTTVQLGTNTHNTSAVRSGQQVTVTGEQRDGFVYAKHIVVDVDAP